MEKEVCGRFAPSPSGRMHLGNLLCGLIAWLSVRSQNGKMILRQEDLDSMRCPLSYARLIEEDLRWFGLDWDEGGLEGKGPHAPYLQSRRSDIYQKYLDKLEQKGLLYPCFCSRAQLHAASAPHLEDGQVLYPGTCRRLTPQQVGQKRKTRSPAIRVKVPDRTVGFTDLHYGRVEQNLAARCGDFILRRSDGVFAYQLAVTVDDGLMGVTQVVRGRDLLSSTPRQIWLLQELGFSVPEYGHIPLLLDETGSRLSKRDLSLDLGELRKRFGRPEPILGKLAYAAGLLDRPEPASAKELVSVFSWDKIPKADLLCPEGLRMEN